MYLLIALIFISKISLEFIPGIPYQSSNIIFQHGMHPYLNILLCLILGGLFILKRLLRVSMQTSQQLKLYSFYIFVFSVYLLTITWLQILFLPTNDSVLVSAVASFLSVFMIYLYGKYIPTQMTPERFVILIQKITVILCWISLVLLVTHSATSFLGGRFVGIFKHIPHMVSTSTLAYVFSLYLIFCMKHTRAQKIYLYASLVAALVALVMTGTRSALAAVIMATLLSFLFFKSNTVSGKFFKGTFLLLVLSISLVFGERIGDYAIQITRGEKSVGYRAAQDGVSSRWEEVLRGYDIFQENPWLGKGLTSKFQSSDQDAVGAYDASKDPHNLIVSAGVLGGWGFVVIVSIGFIGIFILSLFRLKSSNPAIQLLAIYLLTQLPIIFIYHVHISLGGIADRVYWLVIGYLALAYLPKTAKPNNSVTELQVDNKYKADV